VAGIFLVSWWLTRLARDYAVRRSVLDIPNERSSHSAPMPRGGGVAIAVSLLLVGAPLLALSEPAARSWGWAWLGGGLAIASVGWLDDHRPLPSRWRLLIQTLAAAWAVAWLGGLTSLDLGLTRLSLGPIGTVLAVIALVWLTNLYNFMDGIDGLAGMEAVFAAVAGGALLWWKGALPLALASFLLAGASAGFLAWNWPPAKIFMGDVGSGLLGFSFGVIALAAERSGVLPALLWVMLLSVFICDATFTLLRRMLRGEQWYNPHRSHAYQKLVRAELSHGRVTAGVLLVNIVLVWPLACCAALSPHWLLLLASGMMLVLGLIWRMILRWE